jgi:hypothetical protein
VRAAADGAAPSTAPGGAPSPPSFTVIFEEADGTRTLTDVESGDILRDVMLDAEPPVDLYTTWCDMDASRSLSCEVVRADLYGS